MENTISACIIAYNEESVIERCLKSIKSIADEIIVIHDGPCKDKTLKIARRYTSEVFIRPRKGLMEGHLVFAYKKAKSDWILRIDADEFLPKKTQQALRSLVNNQDIDAYSLLCRVWYDKECVTSDHKLCLFRKNKLSFLEFPLQIEDIDGKVTESDYELEHKPKSNILAFSSIKSRHLTTLKKCALYNLVDQVKLEKIGNPRLKFTTRFKRKFPVLAIFPLPLVYLIINLFSKEMLIFKGKSALKIALSGALYQIILYYFVHKYKTMGINNISNIMDYSYLWGENKNNR